MFQNSNRVVTENRLTGALTVARESKKIFVFFFQLIHYLLSLISYPLVNTVKEHNERYVRVLVLVPRLYVPLWVAHRVVYVNQKTPTRQNPQYPSCRSSPAPLTASTIRNFVGDSLHHRKLISSASLGDRGRAAVDIEQRRSNGVLRPMIVCPPLSVARA